MSRLNINSRSFSSHRSDFNVSGLFAGNPVSAAQGLASLRVLGFRRSEISAILLGEMAAQVLLALPLGMAIGYAMVLGLTSTVDPETYSLPVVLSARTYAFATVIVLASSALSALLVRRRLDKLDLIGALKTRQ